MLRDILLFVLGKKEGFDLSADFRFVIESQYWTDEQIMHYQEEKLKKIISHAYNNVPFYKKTFDNLGLLPGDIKSLEDLSKLPIIRKQDVSNNPSDFLAKDFRSYHPVHHHTGGTTGKPFQYYNDRKSWSLNWALKMRTFEWAGYRYGKDRLGVMAGGSLSPKQGMTFSHRVWRFINNYYTMPITHMTPEIMDGYEHELKRQKIRFLRGYPSAIASFAEYLNSCNRKLPMLAVFTTAEMLYPHQRKIVELVFECKVFDTYGCGDGMGHATECEQHDGLHICFENSIMQVVNDRGVQVKPGEEGEIVLTSLSDFAMPLIRYAPGDLAALAEKKCSCGRSMQVISKIIGRTSDSFTLSNGRIINGLSLPFEDLTKEVEQFQIVQEAIDQIRVLLVAKKVISEKRISSIEETMRYHCGDGISIVVEQVNEIEVPASEKFRYVISKVKNS